MALDERYIVGINLGEYFVDKTTGEALNGGTIEFYEDTSRSTPKNVFELTGSPPNYTYTVLPNPLDISSVGTIVNNSGTNVAVYYFPFDDAGDLQLYYIEVKDSDGNVQLTREGWPNVSESTDPTVVENSVSNEIANSQFVDTFFENDDTVTLSFTGSVTDKVYNIAPDWDVVLSSSGTGSVTLTRTAVAGSTNLPTNPPYTLDIAPGSNISSMKLRQRLDHNPSIWSSGFLAGFMVISSLDAQAHTIEMHYNPSVGSATTIISGSTDTSGHQEISGTIELPDGTNTDTAATGYVDIEIILPVTGNYNVTSIQVVGLNTDDEDVQYDQQTVNRQEDHLFHYYNTLLQAKTIDSYLVGWDFPLNPAQANGDSVSMGSIGTNKSKYLWDQTIGFQTADSGFSVDRTAQGNFEITAGNTTQCALVQYLDGDKMKEMLNNRLSAHLKGYLAGGLTSLGGTISLYYTTDGSLPDVSSGTNNSLVATLDSNGKPATFNGSWTEVPRSDRGDAAFTMSSTDGTDMDEIGFAGWELDDLSAAGNATFFAIVVGFESMDSSEIVVLESISLVPGDIPTRPAPKTVDQVTQECELYYEKSYGAGVTPGTNTTENRYFAKMTASDDAASPKQAFPSSFNLPYHTIKRASPTVTFYSTDGTADTVLFSWLSGGSAVPRSGGSLSTNPGNLATSNWTVTPKTKTTHAVPANTTAVLQTSDGSQSKEVLITYHYTVDARLGIV